MIDWLYHQPSLAHPTDVEPHITPWKSTSTRSSSREYLSCRNYCLLLPLHRFLLPPNIPRPLPFKQQQNLLTPLILWGRVHYCLYVYLHLLLCRVVNIPIMLNTILSIWLAFVSKIEAKWCGSFLSRNFESDDTPPYPSFSLSSFLLQWPKWTKL